MTEQRRRQICAELARRMGYNVVQSPYKEFRFYRLVSPNGERSGLCESKTEAWSLAPDPFTNAADKDALVAWLAADRDRMFDFCESLRLRLGASNGMFAYELIERILTASYETITLAACKALGIGEAESD